MSLKCKILLLAGTVCLFASVGCRAKLSVKTKSGGAEKPVEKTEASEAVQDQLSDNTISDASKEVPNATPKIPAEDADGIFILKTQVQTRTPVKVFVHKDFISDGSSFSVRNVTNGDSLPQIILIDRQNLTESILTPGLRITRPSDDHFLVEFNPAVDPWREKFFFSRTKPNQLKFINEADQKFAVVSFLVSDFNLFGNNWLSGFAVPSSSQALDGRSLMGWMNQFGGAASVTSEGYILHSGLETIVHQN